MTTSHDGDGGNRHEEAARARLGRALVLEVAGRLARQLGGVVPRSDLESAGNAALVPLLRAHDPRGAPLEAYLRRFLKWAMLDALRRERSSGLAASRSRGVAAMLWVGVDTAEESEPSGPDPDALTALRASLSVRAAAMVLASVGRSTGVEPSEDSSREPDRVLVRQRLRQALQDEIAALEDARCRDVVVRHYFHDEAFLDIAENLRLSPSQVCRLHRRALAALDRGMRRRGHSEFG